MLSDMGQQRVDFSDDPFPLEKWRLFLKRFVPEQHGKCIEAKQVLERVDVAAVFPKQRDQLTEIVSERILDSATRTPRLKGLLSRLLCVESKNLIRKRLPIRHSGKGTSILSRHVEKRLCVPSIFIAHKAPPPPGERVQ